MIASAHRLASVKEYYFSTKLKEVRTLLSQGKPIVNMGIGSPDIAPPKAVLTALQESVQHPKAHQYQSYQGLPELREAIAAFYQKKFKVAVNPADEILPLMGSKEGILHISLAFLNPGDAVLVPNPGYPTYSSVAKLVGATPIAYSLTAATQWQPDFDALEKEDLTKVKIMWVNYPHMPTGAVAQKNTFEKLIHFAKKHDIVIVNDNPYSFILNETPQSILQVPGAKEVALELNSMSKSFNMAGWRVGMVLGNPQAIEQLLKVKTQMDSGMFFGVQQGAIAALQLSEDWFEGLNKTYQERRTLVWLLAEKVGCTVDKNAAGLFVWAKIPEEVSAEELSDRLLYKHDVFVAPGTVFGSEGAGYLRFSLCVSVADIQKVIERISLKKKK